METMVNETPIRNDFLSKLLRSKVFWALFCLFFFTYPLLRSVNRELPPDLPVLSTLPKYELVDENGSAFGAKDLAGRFYLANFHFTNCPTICAKLMETTQKIQKRIKGMGQKVAIVSFTVDPDNDTPQTLFKHARKLNANPYVWKFLTGTKDELNSLLIQGFKVPMGEKPANVDLYDIAHSGKIVLVDYKGDIRGYYSSDENGVNKLMIDLGLIVNRPITKGADNV